MKQKFFLIISLVLLAVQGWATPIDSLETLIHKNNLQNKLSNLSNVGIEKPIDANVLGLSGGKNSSSLVHMEFDPSSWISWLIDLMKRVPTIYIEELNPNDNFFGTAVGATRTKNYRVWGKNLYGYLKNPDYIKLELENMVADTYAPGYIPADGPGMFSISQPFFRPDEIDINQGGEKKIITVTYRPTNAGLHISQTGARAISNGDETDFDYPVIIIAGDGQQFVGDAVERIITVDRSYWNFESVEIGETDNHTFTVTGINLTGEMTLQTDNPCYEIFPTTLPSVGGTVTVTYIPSEAGAHCATLTISGGGVPKETMVELNGTAVIPSPPTITVEDTSLNFGSVRISEKPTQTIIVTGTNLTNDINISISGETGMFTALPYRISPADAKDGRPVVVTYNPTAAGTHTATMTISSEGAESKTVDLSGKCVANPTITVNTTSLDFETVEVGQEKPMTINVTGTDLTGPITVMKEETHGGQFSISRETLNASGGSVIVTFKPTEAGTFGGCVKISGGGASPVSVTLNGSTRQLSVTKSSLDFGTIKNNETATRKFTVYGDNLLGNVTLLSSKPDLFEVIPETITPAEAKAGKEVTVIYKPTAGGTHSGKIIVNAEGVTNKEVAVSGKCAEIKVNKTSLDFGAIEVGEENPITLNVTGTNVTGSITVTKEETHGGQFTISRETLPASGGSVIVTFKPTEAGSFGGRVRISGEGASPVSVSLTGKALELSVYPTSLNFGTTYKNGSVPKKFTVYGGNLTGNVTLSSSNAKFTVTPTTITPAEAKAGKEVTVTFKPTAAGSYSGEITISASGVKPKKVSVSGKCAVISSNPTSYNFGNVAVGKPVTKEIIVTGSNLTGAMSITLAETEGGQYSINKTTLPASGGTVIVTFKPTDAKTFGASLKISGGSAAAVSVSLTGKGVTPTITTNKSTLTFTGSSITSDYVKVTGTNLDDVISLTVTGSTNFTVSPSTISISDAADGKQVKVTCNPKNASSAEATLKITSPYASTKYVTLKYSRGSNGGGETQICSVEPEGGNEGDNNEFMNRGSLEVMGSSTADVNELAMASKVYAEGLNIIIETPIEQKALISDIAGHVVDVNLQAGRNEIPVNSSGVYVVRIREKCIKLMLK